MHTITIGPRTYKLVFDFRAAATFEKNYGRPLAEVLGAGGKIEITFELALCLLHAGMQRWAPLSLDQVGMLVSEHVPGGLLEQLNHVVEPVFAAVQAKIGGPAEPEGNSPDPASVAPSPVSTSSAG